MSTMQVILIIVIAIIVIAAFAAVAALIRRRNLQQRFGPEYDRVVSDSGSRREAEKELRARERRHAELDLRPLSEQSRRRYVDEWEEIQARFLDTPQDAARAGDELLTRLAAERGYPTGDFDERLAELSVEHGRTLGGYREAHDVIERDDEASTEQLRQALVRYRALFSELVGESATPTPSVQTSDGSVQASDGSVPDRDRSVPNRDRSVPNRDRSVPDRDGSVADRDGQARVTSDQDEHEEEDHDAFRR
jgi:hypothetical protein